MKLVGSLRARRLVPLLGLACLACGDSSDPSADPNPLRLSVAIRLDSALFVSTGEFVLDLVPSDVSGRSYVLDPWDIGLQLLAPGSVSGTMLRNDLQPADTAPISSAILIDDSGSMLTADPERRRATAAQLFYRRILPQRPGNRIALLDFGRGEAEPTPGFRQATILAHLTDQEADLDAALDAIQAVPGGGTPLYAAAQEVMAWLDSVADPQSVKSLVVITDGSPDDPDFADSLYALASASRIPIFAVGVGKAGQQDPPTTAALLIEELARRTGGIYAIAEPPVKLESVLQVLAESASPARLLLRVQLAPLVARGTPVQGRVAVEGTRGRASADWSFVAP